MKRIISCVLVIFISLGIPLKAKEVAKDTEEIKTEKVMEIGYDDLEGFVRENNKTIQANKKIIKSLRIRDDIERHKQDLNDTYSDLEDLYNALGEAGGMLGAAPFNISAPEVRDVPEDLDPDAEGEGEGAAPEPGPSDGDRAVRGAIMTLIYGISELSNSMMTTVYDAIEFLDIDEEYIDRVELQLNEIDDQIVMGSQLLYIAHEYLQLQLDDLERKQEVLDYNIFLADKKFEVGMMTHNELLNAKLNQTPLTSGIETLQLEMDTLKDRVSSLIYLDYDVKKEFSPLPEVKDTSVSMMNYGSDYNIARGENHQIKQKRKAVDIAKLRYDDKKYDENVKSLKLTEEAADLKYEGELKKFDTAFQRAFKEVKHKARLVEEAQSYYEMETENHKLAQLKYDQGFTSNLALTTAKDTLGLKEFELQQAEVDLFSAMETYKWALRGTLSAPENPSK